MWGFFQRILLYLRETHIIWSDSVNFFKENPLYLRETQIIWSDNASILDKPTLSADNAGFFFQKILVYLW